MTVSLPRPCGILLACGLFLAAIGQAVAAPITVYAAASLSESLQACADQYRARTGQTVRISFAASSTLARQIDAGAQADLFISADADWMDFLAVRQRIQSKTRRDLLGNRLVLIAAREDPVQLTLAPGLPLAERLGHERLAVADPDAVPAGRYARAALSALHVWDGVATRLARADNVRVALQYVARGEAKFGIVYDTDARADPRVRIVGVFPAQTHPPIRYPAALTMSATPAAADFLAYLRSAAAAPIWTRYGFVPL
jgi:molybdate transport system substrate-binding protein